MPSPRFLLPALALVFNTLVWGVSWWPFRELNARGLHPLWATVLVFVAAVIVVGLLRPRAFGHLLRTPTLWVLMLAAGTTNAAFNWAVVIGDVVRVVLLFYLMPLWVVVLARWLLKEALTLRAAARVLLALAGAAIVLWPEGGGLPVPRAASDWLALLGGFTFALNNVMLRREAHQPDESRALAMFLGCVLVAGVLACALALRGQVAWPPVPAWGWVAIAAALSLGFLLSNACLQYGAARLPANITAVVMLTEVLFASGSAVMFGGERVTAALFIGGSLIILAALMSSLARPRASEATRPPLGSAHPKATLNKPP